MAANKNSSGKKAVSRISPAILVICTVAALILGLVIGFFIPAPGANLPSTPLSAVKVEDLSVNAVQPEDPVTLRFKLNGLPEGTQLALLLKHEGEAKQISCTVDGSYYSCDISELSEEPTHVTLVLVHKGTSVYLPLVRNLSRSEASIGYLSVWDYQ